MRKLLESYWVWALASIDLPHSPHHQMIIAEAVAPETRNVSCYIQQSFLLLDNVSLAPRQIAYKKRFTAHAYAHRPVVHVRCKTYRQLRATDCRYKDYVVIRTKQNTKCKPLPLELRHRWHHLLPHTPPPHTPLHEERLVCVCVCVCVLESYATPIAVCLCMYALVCGCKSHMQHL